MSDIEPGAGVVTDEFLRARQPSLLSDIQRIGTYSTVREKNGAGSVGIVMGKKTELAIHYALYVRAGRQLFDFPASMTEMFRHTSVDKIPVRELKFRYPAQYLHFGRQPDLELAPGWFVDGAYVCNHEARPEHGSWRVLTIVLTAATPSPHFVRWDVVPEPAYTQAMNNEALFNGIAYLSAYPEDIATRYPDNTPTALHKKFESVPGGSQKAKSKLAALGFTAVHFCGQQFLDILPALKDGDSYC